MAIAPPSAGWWKEPVDRSEIAWISIAFTWCLFMFFMMPYWHINGKQNLSNESYKINPEQHFAKAQAMVDKYTVRTATSQNIPVVAPPVGEDVYLVARLWQWWPMLELEKGKTYRLHLSSMDWQHGFSLQPENINLQVLPGYDMVVKITPDQAGEYTIVCNEFCGIGHHTMLGKIFVKE